MSNGDEESGAELARRFHSAALRLLRRLRLVDQSLGLSTARLSALSVLVFRGPCSLSELADIERVSRPTMTNLVKGLEKDGYVQLKRSKTDGRVSIAHATRTGKTILRRGQEQRIQSLLKMMERLSPSDVKAMSTAALAIESMLQPPVEDGES